MINNSTQFISNIQQLESKLMNQSSMLTPRKKQMGAKKYKSYKKTLQSRKPQLKTTILDNFYLEEEEKVEKAKDILMMASASREQEDREQEDGWDRVQIDFERNNKIQGWRQEYSNQQITTKYKNKEGDQKQFRQKTNTQFVNKIQQKSYLLNHNKANSPYAKGPSSLNKKPLVASKNAKSSTKSTVKANVVVINDTNSTNVYEHRKLSTKTHFSGGANADNSNSNNGHIIKIKERMEKNKSINSSNKQMMFDSRVFRQKCVPLHSFSQVELERKASGEPTDGIVKYKTSHAESGMFKHRHTKSQNCENSISKYIAIHTHTKKPIKMLAIQKEENKSTNLRKLYELIHSFNYIKNQGSRHSGKKFNVANRGFYEKRYKSKDSQTKTYCIKQMVSNFINKHSSENSEECGNKIGDILGRNRRLSVRTVKEEYRSGNNSEKKFGDSSMTNLQLQQIPIRVQLHPKDVSV